MLLSRRCVSIRSVLACCIVAWPMGNAHSAAVAPVATAACAPVAASLPKLPAPTFQNGPTVSLTDLIADFDGWISGMRDQLWIRVKVVPHLPKADESRALPPSGEGTRPARAA
jgi:hypothetical protein